MGQNHDVRELRPVARILSFAQPHVDITKKTNPALLHLLEVGDHTSSLPAFSRPSDMCFGVLNGSA